MVAACPFPANHGTPAGIREMAQAVADKGHQVHIVTYHFGKGPSLEGVQIHRIADIGFGQKIVVGPTKAKPILNLLMVFTLCRVILREKIDLIHAHNYEGALIGYLARLFTRRPMIYNAINTMSDEMPSYNFFKPRIIAVWLAGFLDYIVPRMGDGIIAISKDLEGFLRKQGIPADRIHMIPLGVEMKVFEGRDPLKVQNRYDMGRKPLVLYTGTVDRFQRIDYLLKAMKVVCEKYEEAKLFIVANIASEADIQSCWKMISNLGLQDHVKILPNQPFEEVPSFLAAADVTVLSRPDCPGFPVKLLNYMAAGKPTVLFEGSSKGLQHQQHAMVVKDHDWQGLGEAILQLLEDRTLAQRLGQNAYLYLKENFSWERLSERIEETYYEVLKRN